MGDEIILAAMGLQALPHISPFLTRLLDVASLHFGRFTESYVIRQNADAEAYNIRQTAHAESDAKTIIAEGNADAMSIEARAKRRINNLELRRQRNSEKILLEASKIEFEKVSNKPVDDDWIARFFNHAQDVSTEEMQLLWARVLATEVASPGSFSFRALHTLNSMSKADAEMFSKFCNYLIVSSLD